MLQRRVTSYTVYNALACDVVMLGILGCYKGASVLHSIHRIRRTIHSKAYSCAAAASWHAASWRRTRWKVVGRLGGKVLVVRVRPSSRRLDRKEEARDRALARAPLHW